MIALISPAKTMRSKDTMEISKGMCSEPRFEEQTRHIVSLMLRYSAVELEGIFRISQQIAELFNRDIKTIGKHKL